MAKEGNTIGNGKTSPYGNGDGATTAGPNSGAHDFIKDPSTTQGASGGRDFTKESRSQSEASPEVTPNPQEIPAGGKILFADPGPVSSKVSGTASHIEHKPFRVKG